MRFVILGDDRAGSAFDRFQRQVEKSNGALARNERALKAQEKQSESARGGLLRLTGTITGFSDVAGVASSKGSMLSRVLAGVNVATGIAEPALAGLIVTGGGLAAMFSAAAAGAVAYQLALKPLITQTGVVMKAQDALDKARTQAQLQYTAAVKAGTSPAAAAQARTLQMQKAQAAYNATVKESPPAVRQFAKTVEDTKKTYDNWANRLARPVLRPLQEGLGLVQPLLRGITPLVREAASGLTILERLLAAKISGGGLTSFVNEIRPHIIPAILAMGQSFGNVAAGIWGILKAFLPVSDQVGRGVTHLTELFKNWATSLPSHTGFQSLMSTFREATPLAVQVLKNLVLVLKNVGAATVGLASPANSKALLQILIPVTRIMAQLSANQGLVRTIFYLALLRSTLGKLGGAFGSVKSGAGFVQKLYGWVVKTYGVMDRFAGGFSNAAVAASAFSGKAGTLGGKLASITGNGTRASKVLGSVGSVAGALLGPVGAAAAVIGVLAVATNGFAPTVRGSADALVRQYKATGFNVAGFRELARQTAAATATDKAFVAQQRFAVAAVKAGADSMGVEGLKLRVLSQVHSAAAQAAANLGSRLSALQDSYRLSASSAANLAQKAGVSAQALGASGTAGDRAYRQIVSYASGEGQATLASLRLRDSQNAVKTALDRVNGGLLNGQQALLNYQQAQQTALQAINASTGGLKGNSSAAISARQSIVGTTQAAIDLAQAQLTEKNGVEKATGTIREQIRFLQEHAGKSKLATDQVAALRDVLGQLRSRNITLKVVGQGIWSVVKDITGALSTGGAVRGPGGPTTDQAGLYALSNQEWVIRANSASRYGDKAMDAVNRGSATIWYPGMAAGGKVIDGSYAGTPAGTGAFSQRKYKQTVAAIEDDTVAATRKGLMGIWGAGSGKKLVNYLRPFVGRVPYVWGGTSPAGWDCSGMTMYGLKNALGISAPRTSEAQYGWVKRTRDQVGALAFFVGSGGGPPPGHVGVSLGNGAMINAAGTQWGTIVSGTGGAMGFGIPPGMAKGGKVKNDPQRKAWLAELARYVSQLQAARKAAAHRRPVLRHSMEIDELWFLTHPGVKKGSIDWNEHQRALRRDRHALASYNKREGAKEAILSRKIALLRDLTGNPPGKRYGGAGVPAPVDDGSGGLGGGDTGGGSTGGGTSSGPPPIAPPPMPPWMIAAGLGGGAGAAGASAAAGAMSRFTWPGWQMTTPWTGPTGDPVASRWAGPHGGTPWGRGGEGIGELVMALKMMSREVTGAVRQVAPGVATGFDRSMTGMTGRVAGKMP